MCFFSTCFFHTNYSIYALYMLRKHNNGLGGQQWQKQAQMMCLTCHLGKSCHSRCFFFLCFFLYQLLYLYTIHATKMLKWFRWAAMMKTGFEYPGVAQGSLIFLIMRWNVWLVPALPSSSVCPVTAWGGPEHPRAFQGTKWFSWWKGIFFKNLSVGLWIPCILSYLHY